MSKFNIKRPRRQEYIDKYGFEGDTYWRLDLLKYEEAKNAFERKEQNEKAYQKRAKAEEERLKMANKPLRDEEPKKQRNNSKKTAAKKPAIKQTKKAAAKQPKKTTKATLAAKQCAKKPAVKKQVKPVAPVPRKDRAQDEKLKSIKHDDNYELLIGSDNDISFKPRRRPKKELRRVAKSGGYTVWDARAGKTFGTQKEANDYAADILKRTGERVSVTKTARQVTHTFKSEN